MTSSCTKSSEASEKGKSKSNLSQMGRNLLKNYIWSTWAIWARTKNIALVKRDWVTYVLKELLILITSLISITLRMRISWLWMGHHPRQLKKKNGGRTARLEASCRLSLYRRRKSGKLRWKPRKSFWNNKDSNSEKRKLSISASLALSKTIWSANGSIQASALRLLVTTQLRIESTI